MGERVPGPAQAGILGSVAPRIRSLTALFCELRRHPGRIDAERGGLQEAPELRLPLREPLLIGLAFHARLPLSANQPASDGDLRHFNRRSYRPIGARNGAAGCRAGRRYRSNDFAGPGADHGHRSQRPAAGRGERRARVDYLLASLKATDGGILGINVVAEEITERKRAEAALAASEIRFRELADNMSQLAWTADAQGWIYWYNKRWHDYAGTTLEEMQGWGWQKVHHPDHVDRVVNRIRHCFETGTPWEDTFSASTPGRRLPLVSVPRAADPQ